VRWLSHHDLLRTFERMLRRATLPVHHSGGFHPHPRIVFALSLPLGVVGLAEVVEVEFDETLDPDTVREQIAAQCPPGLEILDANRVALRGGLRVVGLCYAIDVPLDRCEALAHRAAEVLASTEWIIERTRPPRRMLDIRPYLRDLRLDSRHGRLEMDLHLSDAGTARPDELLTLLNLADLPDAGAVVERVRLDLETTDTQTTPPTDDTDTLE